MLALISTSSFLRCHSSFAFTAVTAAVFSLMLSSFVPTSSSFYFIFIIIFFLSIFCCSYKHYCRRNLSLWHFSSFSSFIINFLDVCEWFFSSRCHISLSLIWWCIRIAKLVKMMRLFSHCNCNSHLRFFVMFLSLWLW